MHSEEPRGLKLPTKEADRKQKFLRLPSATGRARASHCQGREGRVHTSSSEDQRPGLRTGNLGERVERPRVEKMVTFRDRQQRFFS